MEYEGISKNGENFSFINRELIENIFKEMAKEGKASLTLKENPVIFFINLPAGYKGTEEVHENDDDLLYVFDGGAEFLVGNDKLLIKKGDFIHIPLKTIHKILSSEKGIKYLVFKIRKI
jgi:mannose-6-phosphate isomerase-like protein (cupin superfamily)